MGAAVALVATTAGSMGGSQVELRGHLSTKGLPEEPGESANKGGTVEREFLPEGARCRIELPLELGVKT